MPPDAPSLALDHDHQNNHDNSINPNHPGGIGRPPTTSEQNETENGIHPLYPTADGRPPKNGVQPLSKPHKKPSKNDSKFTGPFAPSAGDRPPNKFEFNNYEDEDDEGLTLHRPTAPHNGGPGPGFFNPSATKNQYPDYDQAIFHNEQIPNRPHPGAGQKPSAFNPFAVQGGNVVLGNGNNNGNSNGNSNGAEQQDKLPTELLSILGGNAQNIPPHLRIEHLLQQFQGNGNVENDGQGQHPFGIPSQGGFPFSPQLNQPQIPNQRPAGPGNFFLCVHPLHTLVFLINTAETLSFHNCLIWLHQRLALFYATF